MSPVRPILQKERGHSSACSIVTRFCKMLWSNCCMGSLLRRNSAFRATPAGFAVSGRPWPGAAFCQGLPFAPRDRSCRVRLLVAPRRNGAKQWTEWVVTADRNVVKLRRGRMPVRNTPGIGRARVSGIAFRPAFTAGRRTGACPVDSRGMRRNNNLLSCPSQARATPEGGTRGFRPEPSPRDSKEGPCMVAASGTARPE
jgi:hypothetical protein